jgi:hypothetical protein
MKKYILSICLCFLLGSITNVTVASPVKSVGFTEFNVPKTVAVSADVINFTNAEFASIYFVYHFDNDTSPGVKSSPKMSSNDLAVILDNTITFRAYCWYDCYLLKLPNHNLLPNKNSLLVLGSSIRKC